MCKFLIELFKKIDKPIETVIENNSGEEEPVITEVNVEVDNNEENEMDNEMINEDKKYNGKIILLDNGHGKNCAGKRSPKLEDGSQFFEYEFNRDIVRRIAEKLNEDMKFFKE